MSSHTSAVLQALFVTFLWSTSWVLIRIGLEDIPALTFAGLRYTIAFLCLLPLVLVRGELKPGDNAMVFIRPENLTVAEPGASGNNHLSATVLNEEFEGQSYHVFLEGADGNRIKITMTNKGQSRAPSVGEAVTLSYNPDQAVALPSGTLSDEE